jgi:hypothetical protein|tara:strand:+ start:301 stop:423 length:123 start_codon:yes stop_codon:yes gene_type:complete
VIVQGTALHQKKEKIISRREYEVIFDAGKMKRNARKDAKN